MIYVGDSFDEIRPTVGGSGMSYGYSDPGFYCKSKSHKSSKNAGGVQEAKEPSVANAENASAAEPSAEETKTEAANEAQAKEAKAEEAKTEEPKAEETKAEADAGEATKDQAETSEKPSEEPEKKERKLKWAKQAGAEEAEAEAEAAAEKAKVDEANDKYARLFAEFDNFRKRTEKEKATMFDFGARSIIEKILPVVDNFERGLAAVPEEEKETPFVQGMDKIYKQLQQFLEEAGVKPIEAVGAQFDPNLHSAVMHVDDDSVGENVVVEEFQKGYTYKDSVVRYSMVKVAN